MALDESAETLETLLSRWKGREEQVSTLWRLCHRADTRFSGLYVYGPPSTGKTSVVLDVLRARRTAHAYVDCLELASDRSLLSSVLRQLKVANTEEQERAEAHAQGEEDGVARKLELGSASTRKRKRGKEEADEEEENGGEDEMSMNLDVDPPPPVPHREVLRGAHYAPVRGNTASSRTPYAGSASQLGLTYSDRMLSFGHRLEEQIYLRQLTTFIVLDNAKELVGDRDWLIPSLLRVREQCNRRVCLVLITTGYWPGLQQHSQCLEAWMEVEFSAYNEADLAQLLERRFAVAWPALARQVAADDIAAVCKYVPSLVYAVTRDLRELFRAGAMLMQQFVKLRIAFPKASASSLLGRLRSQTRMLLRHLGRRDLTLQDMSAAAANAVAAASSKRSKRAKTNGHSSTAAAAAAASSSEAGASMLPEVPGSGSLLHLPSPAKLALIASFLASMNPPQHDQAMFTGVSSRKRRRKRRNMPGANSSGAKARRLGPLLLGPKPFPLDRMMVILDSIRRESNEYVADEEMDQGREASIPTAVAFYAQVSSLISLALLSYASKSKRNVLEQVKLVCNVTYERIMPLANDLGIALDKYLYDPRV